MRSKVQKASAIALTATLCTALLSAQGSGAAAEEAIPVAVQQKPAIPFVSHPVIQPLPAMPGEDNAGTVDAAGDDDAEPDSIREAASLGELVAAQPLPENLSRELNCLAGAIYFEARGESLSGQLAVGRVIVDRANSGRFPSSYCGVVYQPAQFSFVRGGGMPPIRKGSRDWREAVAIAQIADDNTWTSPAQGALFFHAARVSPRWRLTRLARVDNHIFYR
ncbi:cell wall hydrolase [Novosphingobium album (ex Liu et al. 2023)]|uniref:Cell wall hydrolase n=1 Tax=Novosphingobium album (ex Liu et al. 2023) TaxID=3031130 RepID=A0ABT5WPS8_9SPHN|nr:cell wall hydrolase [Novosphingobium album (ex Liu et al. 2023)]MDE8651761.1 cell wall hydrolase [Novosphingobium album (ex Liu et al. 2023)]